MIINNYEITTSQVIRGACTNKLLSSILYGINGLLSSCLLYIALGMLTWRDVVKVAQALLLILLGRHVASPKSRLFRTFSQFQQLAVIKIYVARPSINERALRLRLVLARRSNKSCAMHLPQSGDRQRYLNCIFRHRSHADLLQ